MAVLFSPTMYKKKHILEVEILDLGDKDQCYGRLPNGMSVFVQGPVAVGDTVRAEIIKIKKNYLVSRLREIVRPSPHRIDPVCPWFGICGGCKWQHIDYAEQMRLKRKQVQDALEHIGGFHDLECEPCIPADTIFGYRNKMDFSFTDKRYLTPCEIGTKKNNYKKPIDFSLGFHAPGCYAKAIDIDHCAIAPEEMNTVLNTVRNFCLSHRDKLPIYSTHTHTGELRNLVTRKGDHTGEFMVNLVTTTHQPELMKKLCNDLKAALGDRLTTFVNNITDRKNTVAVGDREFVVYGPGYITDRLGDYTYRISANSFFQTNTAQAEKLYFQILEIARLKKSEIVYDLYCGTGSIALFASNHCRKVLGIEMVESSVRDARENAKRHNVQNCAFMKLDLKDMKKIREEMRAFGHPDVVITDPPRAGMHPKTIEALLEIAPARIVYVSCNPADEQMLCATGAYKLTRVQPIDMFPQTNHVESIARFKKVW